MTVCERSFWMILKKNIQDRSQTIWNVLIWKLRLSAVVWKNLLKFQAKGYVASCTCEKKDIKDKNEFTKMGLFQPHAYSVLNIEEKKGNRLLKLKNP